MIDTIYNENLKILCKKIGIKECFAGKLFAKTLPYRSYRDYSSETLSVLLFLYFGGISFYMSKFDPLFLVPAMFFLGLSIYMTYVGIIKPLKMARIIEEYDKLKDIAKQMILYFNNSLNKIAKSYNIDYITL